MRSGLLAGLLVVACGSEAAPEPDAVRDTSTAQDTPVTVAPVSEWPDSGAVDYRRERSVDFTGDDIAETVAATAVGPSYDSLTIAITIESSRGDTLWHESWPSLLYFKYDPIEGKADTTVMRIVRDHVEDLLAPVKVTETGGLPNALRRGEVPDDVMREAVQYHLAELDWRRANGIAPAMPTPPEAWSQIDATSVPEERVTAVLNEVRRRPSLMYHAGGEATYVIAWSESEQSFVRIYSCC